MSQPSSVIQTKGQQQQQRLLLQIKVFLHLQDALGCRSRNAFF